MKEKPRQRQQPVKKSTVRIYYRDTRAGGFRPESQAEAHERQRFARHLQRTPGVLGREEV